MNSELAAVIVTAMITFAATWITSRHTSARILLEQLQTERARIRELEARVDLLEQRRENDALVKRRMGDHIDLLELHIIRGEGPPPPPRPEGL